MELVFALVSLVILIYSAILHEIAHGFIAYKLGDPTAKIMGRLTLNPKNHIDPFLSIALPLILILSGSPVVFGAAKPVPVDPFNLRDGRKDMAIVSLAGPLTNIILAIIASVILKIIINLQPNEFLVFLRLFFTIVVQLNLLLAIFNLLPIPPLDGSKIFALLLPEKLASAFLSLGSVGLFIIFFLLLSNGELSLGRLIYSLLSFLVFVL